MTKTDLEIQNQEPEEWKGLISREQFLDYWRSSKSDEELSADDRNELFVSAPMGACDVDKKTLDEIISDFCIENLMVIEANDDNEFTKEHFDKELKDYGITNLKVVEV